MATKLGKVIIYCEMTQSLKSDDLTLVTRQIVKITYIHFHKTYGQ